MNCTTCMIGDFKDRLCSAEFCKKCGADGNSADVEKMLMRYTDMVSVVRCKDCSYWASHDLSVNWCLSILTNTKADDYCSYGERKTDETD